MAKKPSLTSGGTLLTEIAWEVCNQVGGIYTVIRTKVPSMVERWSENYCLIGPYIHPDVTAEFEPVENYTDPFGKAVKEMRNQGFDVHYGRWLVTGRPRVVLVDPAQVYDQLDEIKYFIWKNHQIEIPGNDELVNQVLAFGHLVKIYLSILAKKRTKHAIITHFHEWMAATPIPSLRKEKVNVRIVFTTHATMLGRYLAGNDPKFYAHLPFFNWEDEARKFYISPQVKFERAAAHSSHVFTTVSDVTARECKHLLGKTPHVILPNGLNIERFDIQHEVQNVHHEYKQEINQFVMGHFFQSYSFDLENTLYFFTSGRYEYRNKGFDLTLEALKKLNLKMKRAKMNTTVVAFFITKKPYYSIDPKTMHSRGVLDEVRQTCDAIIKQVSDKLFKTTAASADYRLPVLNEFVSDYWKLRLRRTIQSWKSDETPAVCTHILKDEEGDDILNYLKSVNLMNSESDRVKIVYHADFISPTNPLFGIDPYGDYLIRIFISFLLSETLP